MTRFLSSMRTTLACVAVSMSAFAANAEDLNLGLLEPGVTYDIPKGASVSAEFVPSITGQVKFIYSTAIMTLYSSPTYEEESLVRGTHSYRDDGRMMTYQLTEGEHYYLHTSYCMDATTLVIQEGTTEIELLRVSPALSDGEMFSVSSNYRIDLSFNIPVTVGNVLLLVGDERSRITANSENTYLTCHVADAIMDFYNRGVLKKGDVMTLRVMKVADAFDENNKYNGDGKLEVDFVMNSKPAQLVEVKNAAYGYPENPFNTYYMNGDEAATISFVFDEELSTTEEPVATISYGDSDNIDVGVYKENVPGHNEGNTASFDFSGKMRRPIDMLPASTPETQPEFMGINFYNIYSADGQRVYTGAETNPTAFGMSFKLNLVQYTIASDFTPGRGATLEPGTKMEIWVMNGAFITSKGILISYISGGEPASVLIPMSEVTVEEDSVSPDDMIYTFEIPAINVDPDTKVTISFADVECADGLDHSGELSADFGYDTAGVESVAGDYYDVVTVYNAAGLRVMDKASRTELSKLPKGLYIVNGKKVVIK